MRFKLITFMFTFFLTSFVWARTEVIADSIKKIHPMILKGESFELTSPAGSYQVLLESLNENGHSCLVYKIPLGDDARNGVLLNMTGKKSCSIGTKNLRKKTIYDKVGSLKIYDIDWKKKFSFKIKADEKVIEYFIPFPTRENSFWKGINPILKIDSKAKITSLEIGEICHQGCGKLKNQCNNCPNGEWTSFVSLSCYGELSVQCGSYKCGQRGQRPCVRMTTYRENLSCDEMKKYVFCSYGRELECRSNGSLNCR